MKGKTCGDYGGTTKAGNPCKNPAGFRTNHPGEGKCYLPGHGGCSYGRPLKTGRYAKSLHGRLGKKIREYLEDPDPMDLRPELAVLRARVSFLTEKLDKANPGAAGKADKRLDAEAVLDVVHGIQKIVDTISKVQTRKALTAQESLYILVSLADILQTEIHYIRTEAISDEEALKHIINKLRRRFAVPQLARGSLTLAP